MNLIAAAPNQGGLVRMHGPPWTLGVPLGMVPGGHGLAAAPGLLVSTHDLQGTPHQASGIVNAWIPDGHDGWRWQGAVPTGGRSPCSVAISPDGRQVAVAHFRGIAELGCITLLPVVEGRLLPASDRVERPGGGPHPTRQTHSHIHCVRFLSANRLAIADLGTDQVAVYDVSGGRLREVHALTARPGTGPRSIGVLSPSRLAVTTEMASTLLEIAWDAAAERLTLVQELPLLPADWTGGNSASDCVAGAGWVYAGNRGHDSIACFREMGGRLTVAGHVPCGGKTPRALALSPGRHLAVAVEGSSLVAVFDLVPDQLPANPTLLPVHQPTCVTCW